MKKGRLKIYILSGIGGFSIAFNFPLNLISIPLLIYAGIFIERGRIE